MTQEITKEQINAVQEMVIIVGALLRDLCANRPTHRIPSGEVYSQLTGVMSLATYDAIIQKLIDAKLISRKFHELRWIGPAGPSQS